MGARNELKRSPACPFCGSVRTEMISLFGQNLLSSQYFCSVCNSHFEAVRWEESKRGKRREKGGSQKSEGEGRKSEEKGH